MRQIEYTLTVTVTHLIPDDDDETSYGSTQYQHQLERDVIRALERELIGMVDAECIKHEIEEIANK